MRLAPRLRSILNRLRYTPLHPQWFAYRYERSRYRLTANLAIGKTLDIGCGQQNLRPYLSPECEYFSLDAPTTGAELYGARPDVFGTAQKLPFRDRQFDTVVLLEVLEHLEQPEIALQDAKRLTKAGGKLIISTPFLYPVHDAPWDFKRWTRYGLKQLADNTETGIKTIHALGSPIESGCLLFNLSLAWQTLNAPMLSRLALIPACLLLIPLSNLLGATLSLISPAIDNSRFTNGYIMILEINE